MWLWLDGGQWSPSSFFIRVAQALGEAMELAFALRLPEAQSSVIRAHRSRIKRNFVKSRQLTCGSPMCGIVQYNKMSSLRSVVGHEQRFPLVPATSVVPPIASRIATLKIFAVTPSTLLERSDPEEAQRGCSSTCDPCTSSSLLF